MSESKEVMVGKVRLTQSDKMASSWFKRPVGDFNLRIYPFKDTDGSFVVGRKKNYHFDSAAAENKDKVIPCTPKDCPWCKKEQEGKKLEKATKGEKKYSGPRKVQKMDVAVVDVSTPDKLQCWSMPISVWNEVEYIIAKKGEKLLGNKGRNFEFNYDPNEPVAQNKYHVVLGDESDSQELEIKDFLSYEIKKADGPSKEDLAKMEDPKVNAEVSTADGIGDDLGEILENQ